MTINRTPVKELAVNLDHILDQLADIYDELDRLPKTAELREALAAVSDLGVLLDRIQHN